MCVFVEHNAIYHILFLDSLKYNIQYTALNKRKLRGNKTNDIWSSFPFCEPAYSKAYSAASRNLPQNTNINK